MRRLCCLLTLCSIALATGMAHAGLIMIVDDPSTPEIDMRIEDDGEGDGLGFPGVISARGPLGGIDFQVTGKSKDAADTEGNLLELTVAGGLRLAAGSTGGTVDFLLTDTDFDIGPSTATATYKGGTDGFFNFDFYGDSQNGEFSKGFEIASTAGSGLTGQFDERVTNTAAAVGSLTIGVRAELTSITQTGGVQTGLTLVPIPEPSTMGLMVLALMGSCIAPLRFRGR